MNQHKTNGGDQKIGYVVSAQAQSIHIVYVRTHTASV